MAVVCDQNGQEDVRQICVFGKLEGKEWNERPHPQTRCTFMSGKVCEPPCCACMSMCQPCLGLNEITDKDG